MSKKLTTGSDAVGGWWFGSFLFGIMGKPKLYLFQSGTYITAITKSK